MIFFLTKTAKIGGFCGILNTLNINEISMGIGEPKMNAFIEGGAMETGGGKPISDGNDSEELHDAHVRAKTDHEIKQYQESQELREQIRVLENKYTDAILDILMTIPEVVKRMKLITDQEESEYSMKPRAIFSLSNYRATIGISKLGELSDAVGERSNYSVNLTHVMNLKHKFFEEARKLEAAARE